MYRAVIFFFSSTGETQWVAERIKKQLDARGINADIVSIDSVDKKKADWWMGTADLLVIGWPLVRGDMPEPMKAFVNQLSRRNHNKHIQLFCTTPFYSADGAYAQRRLFWDKNLNIDSTAHFLMRTNVYQTAMAEPDGAAAKQLGECGRRVDDYVAALLEGRLRIKGKHLGWLGALHRVLWRMIK